jgi:hypothetical protein
MQLAVLNRNPLYLTPYCYSRVNLTRNILPILCLLLSIIIIPQVMAQDKSVVVVDSVKVKKGSYFLIDEQVVLIDRDTVFIFVDSLKYGIGNTDDDKFYRELKKVASKRKWSLQLYDILIIEPDEGSRNPNRSKLFIASQRINRYRGREIGRFTFRQLDLFGPSIDDTTREARLVFEEIGNKLHTTTRAKIIENNLLLEKGDILDPEKIQDAERILRELPFIKDARILPIDSLTAGDSVTLQVLTQDVFAYSFRGEFNGLKGGALEVSYNNFLGLGHQVLNEISYNHDYPEMKFGYGAMYRVPNIRRSFISAEANFFRSYHTKLTNIAVSRDFISPEIRYAGGVDVGQRFTRQWFIDQGSEQTEMDTLMSTHNYQNIWLGRSFRVNFGPEAWRNRSRIVISGRYHRKRYVERPEVTESLNQEFHHSKLFLGSLSFSTSHYFRDRLVYSYGRTEDMPYGQKITLNGGYERNEFSDRRLMGVDVSMARFLTGIGYVYGQLVMESYFRNGKSEQGIIRPSVTWISDLSKKGRFRIRHFANLEFTRGVNRFNNEFLTINREAGIRGFRSRYLMGNQRLRANYELVAFSPADFVGFRLAPYFFYDGAFLAQNNDAIYKGKYFHGFGLGVRLRNDNLTFNTIEVRLGFYPNGPEDMGGMKFNFSEHDVANFKDFNVTAPDVTPFL